MSGRDGSRQEGGGGASGRGCSFEVWTVEKQVHVFFLKSHTGDKAVCPKPICSCRNVNRLGENADCKQRPQSTGASIEFMFRQVKIEVIQMIYLSRFFGDIFC